MPIKLYKSNAKVTEIFELAGIKLESWLFVAFDNKENLFVHGYENFSIEDLEIIVTALNFILEKVKEEGEKTSHLN